MSSNASLLATLHAAVSYLLSQQGDDGAWRDYHGLPVGPSDAWVTAYVALGLDAVAEPPGGTAEATARAAAWLSRTRPHAVGWGYNATTEPDADTTAHVLQLLRRHGHAVDPRDEAWLLDKWRAPGGFTTFDGPGAWASVHPCVTPVVYAALSERVQERLRAPMREYLARHRLPNGAWPSYWWRTCHYSTYHNLLLARSLGVDLGEGGARPVVEPHPHFAVRSSLDLAFVVGCAALASEPSPGLAALVQRLIERQQPSGCFAGGEDLRITHHDCHAPWDVPAGELYVDDRHTITTASVVRVLARVSEAWQ